MNMQQIMRQAQKMQKKIEEAQEEAGREIIDASAGGGMVKVSMNGRLEVVSVSIEQEIINPDDQEMLQDLVRAAVNEAVKKAQALVQERMGAVTGGINIPGMF